MPYKDPQAARAQRLRWNRENPERVKAAKLRYRAKPTTKKKERRDRKLYSRINSAARVAYAKKWHAQNRDRARVNKWKRHGLPDPKHPRPDACENCGRIPGVGRGLALDHDHVTGKFRGWLCYRCNLGIGLLGDSVEGVASAVEYLLKSVGL